MTRYQKVPLDLTQKQYENLSKGISSLAPLTLRLTQDQIHKGGGDLMLTGRQSTHLDKSIAKGKGANITLSSTQLKKMKAEHKRGGYLNDMNKCVFGKGMYGVNEPEMPTPDVVGAEPQEGAGVVKETVKKVGKIAKKLAKPALTKGCELGAKALAVKAGADPLNPIVSAAASEGCSAAVNALLGSGVKKSKIVKQKRAKAKSAT